MLLFRSTDGIVNVLCGRGWMPACGTVPLGWEFCQIIVPESPD